MCLFFFFSYGLETCSVTPGILQSRVYFWIVFSRRGRINSFPYNFFLYLIHANQLNCVTSNKGICFFLSRLKVGKFSKANSPFNFALDYCNASASLSNFAFGGTRYVSNLNTSGVLQRRGVSTANVKRGILMVQASVWPAIRQRISADSRKWWPEGLQEGEMLPATWNTFRKTVHLYIGWLGYEFFKVCGYSCSFRNASPLLLNSILFEI